MWTVWGQRETLLLSQIQMSVSPGSCLVHTLLRLFSALLWAQTIRVMPGLVAPGGLGSQKLAEVPVTIRQDLTARAHPTINPGVGQPQPWAPGTSLGDMDRLRSNWDVRPVAELESGTPVVSVGLLDSG